MTNERPILETLPHPPPHAPLTHANGTTIKSPPLPSPSSSNQTLLIPATPESIHLCAQRLREGHLVAFPTETVYGLGGDGLNPTAVEQIYTAKNRPKTSPLILHVPSAADALPLWEDTARDTPAGRVLRTLTATFFPGPLTLVSRASQTAGIPPQITANTGYVAVRSPAHPLARELLKAAQCPIAAPSANRYGHVSPTRASHVMEDMVDRNVWVLDGGGCDVGVESTVARVTAEEEGGGVVVVSVLRHGAVSLRELKMCLEGVKGVRVVSQGEKVTQKGEATVSPGTVLRHYSPDVVSYMIHCDRWTHSPTLSTEEKNILQSAVVIDFQGRLGHFREHSLAYQELSLQGSADEGAARIFDVLRWAEAVEGAQRVFFPQVLAEELEGEEEMRDGLLMALNDRLTRAASGVVVNTLI